MSLLLYLNSWTVSICARQDCELSEEQNQVSVTRSIYCVLLPWEGCGISQAAAAAAHAGHRAWNVLVFVNLLSFPGVRWGWNQALRVLQPIPIVGLCVAAVNQKKKFYFHLLIYWHEGLFLPHVFCADDSLGEAPKCHVHGPTGTAGCMETKPSVFREWSHSRSPWLLSELALLTHCHKWAPGWGPQSGMKRKKK